MTKHTEALEDYKKAIELKPSYADAYNNRALLYQLMGEHDKAKQDYDEAINLEPSYADAYVNRAILHQATGS